MGAVTDIAEVIAQSRDRRVALKRLGKEQRVAADALVDYGLLVRLNETLECADGIRVADLELFSSLVDVLRPTLKFVSLQDCPVFFCTGLVDYPAGGQEGISQLVAAGGQGESKGRAALSCLGELAERISLFSLGRDDPRVMSLDCQTEDLKLRPILGFSPGQECYLREQNPGLNSFAPGQGVPWNDLSERRVSITNLRTRISAQIPAFGVIFGERTSVELAVSGLLSSSGTAVWSDLGTATQKAIFELAERDAFAQAWYNRLGITRVPEPRWNNFFSENLSRFLSERPRVTGLYRIGTDLKTHVVAAISHEPGGFAGCVGVAASRVSGDAANSAVLEMLQGELSLELAALAFRADREKGKDKMPEALKTAGNLRISDELGLAGVPPADTDALMVPFDSGDLEESCNERGVDLWRFDATHPDLGIPCARVLSPQLCSWQPRFGKKRLFAGVVDRGLAVRPGTEADFASRPFPF